jgi:urease accessory protein
MNSIAIIADRVRSGWQARLDLGFARREQATILARRSHVGPLCIQRPLYPEGAGVCHAIVLHPPGGIAGGDELELEIDVGERAHALLTTPGATKWYRNDAYPARQTLALRVETGAMAEWLPQESIVFDGTHAEMANHIELARGAAFVGWDVVCLGRSARGERFSRGMLRMQTELRREGKAIWLEKAVIPGGGRVLNASAGLAGHGVTGTLLAASETLNIELLDACRAVEAKGAGFGVTLLPGLLVARYLGDSAEQARDYFTRIWHVLRMPLAQTAPVAPRIWNT